MAVIGNIGRGRGDSQHDGSSIRARSLSRVLKRRQFRRYSTAETSTAASSSSSNSTDTDTDGNGSTFNQLMSSIQDKNDTIQKLQERLYDMDIKHQTQCAEVSRYQGLFSKACTSIEKLSAKALEESTSQNQRIQEMEELGFDLIKQVDELTINREELVQKVDVLTSERDELVQKVDNLAQEINNVTYERDELEQKVDNLRYDRGELEKKVANLTHLTQEANC